MSNEKWAMLCLSPNKGGLEMVSVDTVKNIKKFAYAISLENSWISNELQGKASSLGVSRPLFRFFPIILAFKISNWVIRNNITLLHLHWTKDLPLGVLIKKIVHNRGYSFKLIVSRHMGISHSKKDVSHKWLYAAVDSYICVCDFVYKQALQRLPISPENIHINYPGVSEIIKEEEFPFLLDENVTNFIVLGRIEDAKGQHLMLKAISELANESIHCYFVGDAMDDEYLDELKNLAVKLHIVDKITFCGFVSNPTRYLHYFDALVLTTYCETFGLVLIEGMQAGIMVIGSNSGGVQEIIDHKRSGLLFETMNFSDLACQLRWLLDNPAEASDMILAGHEKVEQLFNKKTNYRQLECILGEC